MTQNLFNLTSLMPKVSGFLNQNLVSRNKTCPKNTTQDTTDGKSGYLIYFGLDSGMSLASMLMLKSVLEYRCTCHIGKLKINIPATCV